MENSVKNVEVYQVLGLGQAKMILTLLESYGITAIDEYESVGPALGISIAPLGTVHILVSQEDEKSARDILAALDRGDFDTEINESGEENLDQIGRGINHDVDN